MDLLAFDFGDDLLEKLDKSNDNGTTEEVDVRVCVLAMPRMRKDVG